MPNIKSARKRLRQSVKARERNTQSKTHIRKARRGFVESLAGGDATGAAEPYRAYCSVLDRAAKTGVIKKNTAVRRKTRAANALRKIAESSSPSD